MGTIHGHECPIGARSAELILLVRDSLDPLREEGKAFVIGRRDLGLFVVATDRGGQELAERVLAALLQGIHVISKRVDKISDRLFPRFDASIQATFYLPGENPFKIG
jgi:hypothetical protein